MGFENKSKKQLDFFIFFITGALCGYLGWVAVKVIQHFWGV